MGLGHTEPPGVVQPPCLYSPLQLTYDWDTGKKGLPRARLGVLTIFTLFGGHTLAFKAWQSTQVPWEEQRRAERKGQRHQAKS